MLTYAIACYVERNGTSSSLPRRKAKVCSRGCVGLVVVIILTSLDRLQCDPCLHWTIAEATSASLNVRLHGIATSVLQEIHRL